MPHGKERGSQRKCQGDSVLTVIAGGAMSSAEHVFAGISGAVGSTLASAEVDSTLASVETLDSTLERGIDVRMGARATRSRYCCTGQCTVVRGALSSARKGRRARRGAGCRVGDGCRVRQRR